MKKTQLKKIIREIIHEIISKEAVAMPGPQWVEQPALEKYNRKANAVSNKYQRDRQALAGMPVDRARALADKLYNQFQSDLQSAYDDFLEDIEIKDI